MSYRNSKTIDEQQSIIIIRLRQLRKLKNESQAELAEAIGEKKGTIQNIEQSKGKLSLELAGKIARHYHVSTDYICGLADDGTSAQNTLDMLCKYVSIERRKLVLGDAASHEIPFISINASFFNYLKNKTEAEQLRKKGVPNKVIDAWIREEKQKTVVALLDETEKDEYALLSQLYITDENVLRLLENAYNECGGKE